MNTSFDGSEDSPTLFDLEEFGAAIAEDPSDAAEQAFTSVADRRSIGGLGPPLRLTRIRLSNMLGFQDATIYPSSFSVLVGANNSGKSSLMRAIVFAQTLMRIHVDRRDRSSVILARGRNIDDPLFDDRCEHALNGVCE